MKKRNLLLSTVCMLLAAGLLAGCAFLNIASNDTPENKTESISVQPESDETEKTSVFQSETDPEPTQQEPDETVQQPETKTPETQPRTTLETEQTENSDTADSIEILLQQMTLRQKVGQLFIVRPDALDPEQIQEQIDDSKAAGVTELTDSMKAMLEEYPVGGIAMFSKNIVSPEQITAFNTSLQSTGTIPMFLSVDEEGGSVSRLANHAAFDLPTYESAAAVGSIGDASAAQSMGSTIGAYLKEYGFNMDFAPDADVNTNPNNPVIGKRAFSSDAGIAAQMASAMAEGLRQQGIIPVFKHFPGHGDTAQDSHTGIAISNKTAEEMRSCEWLPFEAAGSGDCIMVGHIAVPNINGELTPATMSDEIVESILKDNLGFQGLVITDSLSMGAITEQYSPAEAALGALQAGCDILLMPNDLQEAFDAIVHAVENGSLSEQRLDESVRRILEYKQVYGILH